MNSKSLMKVFTEDLSGRRILMASRRFTCSVAGIQARSLLSNRIDHASQFSYRWSEARSVAILSTRLESIKKSGNPDARLRIKPPTLSTPTTPRGRLS
jgi:hypothetical protein